MSAYILIPDTNPVKHVEKDIANTDNIHLFDKYNYRHTVQEFEGFLPYTQKWIKGVPIKYQIWLHNVEHCSIDAVDCNGMLLQNYPLNVVLPGYLINDITYDIGQISIDTTALPVAEFFLILNYQKDGSPTIYKRISEPQQIVEELKPAIVLKYKHSQNEYNTIYKTSFNNFFEQDFYFCVEGRVRDDKPGNNRQTYEDQRLNLTLLNSKPFDIWRFFFGSGRGLPPWAGSKLNMILSHDTITADDIQFTFIDELNKKDAGYYSRYLYEATARYSVISYVKQCFVPEPPDVEGGLALPDGTEGVVYNYIQPVTGQQPIAITGTIVKPAWLTISINAGNIIFGGTPGAGDVGTGIAVSFDLTNTAGTTSLSDNIDVIAAATCVAVAFVGTPVLPNANVNQPYNGFIPLSGTGPYILSNITKPAWASIAATSGGIQITGTPTSVSAPVLFEFNISNCGGGAGFTIGVNQFINVISSINITGNTAFSIGLSGGSGSIIAPPGTLVTVTITATGISGQTFSLATGISGASVTGSTSVTNGSASYTFVSPASGSVYWSATFTGTSSAGSGSISVS